MHLNAPKVTVTSVRDFAGKYAMFVLSILTALMLEHLGQKLYHYKIASEAAVKIDEELRANLAEIRQVHATNVKQYAVLDELSKSLGKDIKANLPDQVILSHFEEAAKGKFSLNLQTATLRHEAWDVAVANQSASHMPPEKLQRYSKAYARLRDEEASVPIMLQMNLDGPRMMNVMGDLAIGKAAPLDLFHVLLQIRSVIREAVNTGRAAEKDLASLVE